MHVPSEVLRRGTARSRLRLPSAGKFGDVFEALMPEPVGRYWAEGRNLAAAAALADS
jgi:hypothetical protein